MAKPEVTCTSSFCSFLFFCFFFFFTKKVSTFIFIDILCQAVFNKTIIIPLALVGYEIIIGNSALRPSLAICHLVFNARSWNSLYLLY